MKEIKDNWFAHDYNSANDPKIMILISKFGNEGYGLYWRLIEHLYKCNGYMNKQDLKYIAISFNVEEQKLLDIIQGGLFVIDDDKVYSNRVLEEINKRQTISDSKRKAIEKRWNKN